MKPALFTQVSRYLILGAAYLMIIGCDVKLHKDYAYQQVEHTYAWGILHATLLGKDKIIDSSNSVRGSPYSLLVWASLGANVSRYSNFNCSFELESLHLLNAKSQKIAFSASKLKANFKAGYKGSYEATLSFEGLDLSYDDYSLEILFSVTGSCSDAQKEKVQLPMTKDYREQKITFWDQLMGI